MIAVSKLNAPTLTQEETFDLKKKCSAVVDAVETASTVVLVSVDRGARWSSSCSGVRVRVLAVC